MSGVEGSRRWAENAVRVLSGRAPWGLANPDVVKRIAVMREQGSTRWEGVPDFHLSAGFWTGLLISRHNPQTFAVGLKSHRSGIPRHQDLLFRYGRI